MAYDAPYGGIGRYARLAVPWLARGNPRTKAFRLHTALQVLQVRTRDSKAELQTLVKVVRAVLVFSRPDAPGRGRKRDQHEDLFLEAPRGVGASMAMELY
eukprot:868012-Prymnesium_polylepis.1